MVRGLAVDAEDECALIVGTMCDAVLSVDDDRGAAVTPGAVQNVSHGAQGRLKQFGLVHGVQVGWHQAFDLKVKVKTPRCIKKQIK